MLNINGSYYTACQFVTENNVDKIVHILNLLKNWKISNSGSDSKYIP